MSRKAGKDFDDVGALMNQLDLGAIRYREFGAPKTSAQAVDEPPAVAATPAPAPAPAEARAVATPPPAQPQVQAPVVVAPADDPAKRLRTVTGGSPLNFTFERLRRQAIGTAGRTPTLMLNLPERYAVSIDVLPRVGTRPLAEVFAEIEAAARQRVVL